MHVLNICLYICVVGTCVYVCGCVYTCMYMLSVLPGHMHMCVCAYVCTCVIVSVLCVHLLCVANLFMYVSCVHVCSCVSMCMCMVLCLYVPQHTQVSTCMLCMCVHMCISTHTPHKAKAQAKVGYAVELENQKRFPSFVFSLFLIFLESSIMKDCGKSKNSKDSNTS